MIRSTLTDQGQTTIPAAVRRALGLMPRQRLIYEIIEGGAVIRPETESLMDLAGSLRSDRGPFTDEQMDQAVADEAARRFRRTSPAGEGE